jgi:hypothetical protein
VVVPAPDPAIGDSSTRRYEQSVSRVSLVFDTWTGHHACALVVVTWLPATGKSAIADAKEGALMQSFRMFVGGAIILGVLATLAPSAAGSVSMATDAQLCDQVSLTGPDLSALGSPSKFNKSQWKNAAKEFKGAANGTPGNVKSALNTMASYFDKVGKAGSANAALKVITAQDTAKFTKATIVWDKYLTKVCS